MGKVTDEKVSELIKVLDELYFKYYDEAREYHEQSGLSGLSIQLATDAINIIVFLTELRSICHEFLNYEEWLPSHSHNLLYNRLVSIHIAIAKYLTEEEDTQLSLRIMALYPEED